MKSSIPVLCLAAALWLAGCPEEPEPADDDNTELEPEPAEQLDDWCDAGLGGAPREGDGGLEVDLSLAHGAARLFTPTGSYRGFDLALQDVLEPAQPFGGPFLQDYAESLDEVCAVAGGDGSLVPANVALVGDVAVVIPGTGDVALPEGTAAVVVDVRALPAGDEGDAALDAAVGLALAEDVPIGSFHVRIFQGFPIQWDTGMYYAGTEMLDGVVAAGGSAELPLVFFTGPQLGPHASEVIGGLRLAGRAWIVGYDVFAAVAESRWSGVGDDGLLWRSGVWSTEQGEMWPDRIPADLGTTTPERVLDELAGWGEPGDAPSGDAERLPMGPYPENMTNPLSDRSPGAARAMLVVAHGLLEHFYTYFPVVGYHTDAALLAGLDEVETIDPEDATELMAVLGHFLHETYDGHGFYDLWTDYPSADGYLALQIQNVVGQAVVRASDHPEILAGDTIVAVDGIPADEWYEEAMSRYSAATGGYRFELATRELKKVYGARTLTLVDPDGVEHTATPEPRPYDETTVVPWGGTYRESGWLSDLGAPRTYFLNLNGDAYDDWSLVLPHLQELHTADHVVVDMRDYPAINHYQVARYLMPEPFESPQFGIPTWIGPTQYEMTYSQYDWQPTADAFTGPMVLMVSNKTVSAAENFSMMLVGRPDLTIVGQPSAATNGNITGAFLPGGCYMYFTGMEVLFPGGETFHGTGIVPDVEVVPTPAQFRDGVDPELEAAIDALGL